MKNLLKLSLLGLVLAVFSSTSVEASMLIDGFDDSQTSGTTEDNLALPGLLASADRTLEPVSGFFESSPTAPPYPSFLAGPSQLKGLGADTYTITWDDFTEDFTNGGQYLGFVLGGLNVLASGASPATLSVITSTGSFSSVLTDIPNTGTTNDHFVPFSSFLGIGTPNFASVTSLSFEISIPSGGNPGFTLESISVGTPEPSSLILCGFGLVAAGAYSYRRRRQGVKANA